MTHPPSPRLGRLSPLLAVGLLLLGCGDTAPGALELRAGGLVSVNGGPAETRVTAILVRDGLEEEVDATLRVVEGRDVTLEGDLLRAPARAQTVQLSARYDDAGETVEASLTLDVRVRREVLVNRLRFDALDRFRDEDEVEGDGSQLSHPVEGATLPANVAPLDFVFDGGEVGDHFRLRLESERVVVEFFLQWSDAGIERRIRPDAESWARLLEDAAGADLTARVDRLSAAGVIPGRSRSLRVASEPIFGDVIAWAVQDEPARSTLTRLAIDDRPVAPLPELGEAECTGCHASGEGWLVVSRDLSDSRLLDLATGDVQDGFSPSRPLDAASFAPGGGSLVASTREWPGSLPPAPSLLSWLGLDGAPLDATGLPEGAAASPALSTDALFYVEGGSDHPGGTDAPTRLMRAAVTSFDPPALDPPTLVADGEALRDMPEGGETISRPSVSADGALVVFAHGTHSRLTDGETSALYAARVGDPPIRLAAGVPPESETRSAWPALIDGEAMAWVVYYARDARGVRALWLSALDPARLDAGEDPSSPPFRLPGGSGQLMAPSFAAAECRVAECRSDLECCSGTCSASTWTCAP